MVTKVNILIDGGFFIERFKQLNNHFPKVEDVEKLSATIMKLIKLKTGDDTKDVLLRVFFYDCRPFGKTIKDSSGKIIDYSKQPQFSKKNKFIDGVAKLERFALRLGDLSFNGWKQDKHNLKLKPDFKQKGVDMKFGLDIASMATKHTVDKIVLVAGDSDFIAPIKMARKEGLQVYLYPMDNYVKGELLQHCDFILK